MEKVHLLGVDIDNIAKPEALARVAQLVEAGRPSLVVTPNVDVLMTLRKDPEYRRIYAGAALVLTDGVPLLWAARFLGTPIREKIPGSSIFADICGMAADKGYRLFFMGGRPGAAAKAAEVVRAAHPSVRIVGVYCPPLGFENDEVEMAKVSRLIRESKPHILFLGLGSPKQEKWFDRYSASLGIPVTMGIGITFEYTSGLVQRAPSWMQHVGLEWLFRLWKEPRRLWKRYLVNDPGFFWQVVRQKLEHR
jgi:N-acetylglucosaminyldiphosphoundecaprenol N-acetyl-beta-D-mannosaminyltransferase